MISRLHLVPIVFIVGLVWLFLLVVDGVAIELAWLPRLTAVVPVLLVVLGVFDRWLWRLPWINGWFAKRPVLCGTWQVTLQTEWKDPKTGEVPGPNICYMVVRQTFSILSMRLMTKESSSELVAERIVQAEDGVFRILGVYTNKPRVAVRHRSEIHFGALLLDVQGDPATSLEGHYWTDRSTRGSMTFTRHEAKVLGSYDEAHSVFAVEKSS
jgi:SMODS-associating 2TM, beta-strand rich effector domain